MTGGRVMGVPPLCRVSKASLSSILCGEDLEIAVWHIEGRYQRDMAEWLGVSLPTIERRIARIRRTLAAYGLSLPESPAEPTDTRRVRQHDPSGYTLN